MESTIVEEESLDSGDNSNNSSTGSCRSEHVTNFQTYGKRPDDHDQQQRSNADDEDEDEEGEENDEFKRFADGKDDVPMALDKPKDYAMHRNETYSESSSGEEPSSVTLFRENNNNNSDKNDQLPIAQKDAVYNFSRDIRDKSLHNVLDKNLSSSSSSSSSTIQANLNEKDFDMIKNYGLSADHRVKDFNFNVSSRITLENRFRVPPPHRHVHHQPQTTFHVEPNKQTLLQNRGGSHQHHHLNAITTFERIRQTAHHPALFHTDSRFSQVQPTTSPVSSSLHFHPPITQINRMQQMSSSSQQQQQHHLQQHQHQQTKSFTIDAILGLRASAQRDNNKHQRYHHHHPYKKQQGQENTNKSLTVGSCSNGNNTDNNNVSRSTGGKLKRVRTIFTAEQLERLEDEFTRQQYMVGPERLYLAHTLRLTEAQVKVWFQNRRIKWRKHNHEQTSQRLHEFHQRTTNSLSEREDDSNENATEW